MQLSLTCHNVKLDLYLKRPKAEEPASELSHKHAAHEPGSNPDFSAVLPRHLLTDQALHCIVD